jgi:hypothetical protein
MHNSLKIHSREVSNFVARVSSLDPSVFQLVFIHEEVVDLRLSFCEN